MLHKDLEEQKLYFDQNPCTPDEKDEKNKTKDTTTKGQSKGLVSGIKKFANSLFGKKKSP